MKDMSALRRNLRAVEDTRQIANALFLLSTSRMKRCQQQVAYNKTYITRLRLAAKDILEKVPETRDSSLFAPSAGGAHVFFVIASDKGMCGAYNTDVVNAAVGAVRAAGGESRIEVAGARAAQLLREHGVPPDAEWFIPPLEPALYYARRIGEHLVEMYRSGQACEVSVVYTEYENSARQTARVQRLLPLDARDFSGIGDRPYCADMLYEPDVHTVLENLMVQYTVCMVHELVNLSLASEHCARRNAMQSATDNADGMLRSLSAAVNQARQLTITAEITEIAAAAALMEKAI